MQSSRLALRAGDRLLVSLGGNAIKRPRDAGTEVEMFAQLNKACAQLADLVARGHRLAITHGNGPQVGAIFLRNQHASDVVPPWSLNLCVAESEGLIGYMFQQTLANQLLARKLPTTVVTLVTQCVVDKNDPAWKRADKPIGHFYSEVQARAKTQAEPSVTLKEFPPHGWRVVVPSPRPLRIVEQSAVLPLVRAGVCVVACGGGGVPVVEGQDGQLTRVDCVVDKDHASVVFARLIPDLDGLVCLTDVDAVYRGFNSPQAARLAQITVGEAKTYIAQGEFTQGSMLPKVEAAVQFVEETSKPALITGLDSVVEALEGRAGTLIVP